jgi:hypothetical protein
MGGGEAVDDGDQTLMRGLVTALPFLRPRLSLSCYGRRQSRPKSVGREFLYRCLASTHAQGWAARGGLRWLHRLSDCPDKSCKFARDRGHRHGQLFAAIG